MRALLLTTVAALTLTAAACGDDDGASADATTSETTIVLDVPDVVGDSVADATTTLEAAGLTLRVVRRDGQDLPSTMDFVEKRVNVAVETKEGTEVVTDIVSIG